MQLPHAVKRVIDLARTHKRGDETQILVGVLIGAVGKQNRHPRGTFQKTICLSDLPRILALCVGVKIQLNKDCRPRSCQRVVIRCALSTDPAHQPSHKACLQNARKISRSFQVFIPHGSKFHWRVAATMAASRSSSNSSGSVGKELRLCFYGCGLIAEHHVVAVQRCREAGEVELQPPSAEDTNAIHDEPFSCNCLLLVHASAWPPPRHARLAYVHALVLQLQTRIFCVFFFGVATFTIALFTWPCTTFCIMVLCAIAS